jgi:hypothetical protein
MQTPQGTTDLLSPKPVQFHPLCRLGNFGTNALGDNLYRVVFAPSRMKLIGGAWADGKTEYRFTPLYKAKGWILERWLSAFEFCGMGPDMWNIQYRDFRSGLLLEGPYPDRGEYEMCWDFEETQPTHGYACRVIDMIKAGRLRPHSENMKALKESMAKEEADKDARQFDEIKNSMPTFGAQPFVGQHGKRSFKHRPELVANGKRFGRNPLPTKAGKFITA